MPNGLAARTPEPAAQLERPEALTKLAGPEESFFRSMLVLLFIVAAGTVGVSAYGYSLWFPC